MRSQLRQSYEIKRLREKAQHDEAQALYHAEQKGEQRGMQMGISKRNIEIAKNLMKMGMPLDQIAQATGLTQKEIADLR